MNLLLMDLLLKNQKKDYDISYVNSCIYLDDKIEYFYSWVQENSRDDFDNIKKLIEKAVFWYEFRYPNNYFDLEDVDDFMLGEVDKTGCNKLQWCDVFNYEKFYYTLTCDEKLLLSRSKFPHIVDLSSNSRSYFHVSDDGIIIDADGVSSVNKMSSISCRRFFEGKRLKEAEKINREENLGLNLENVIKIVNRIEHRQNLREVVLDTIMYRIIENGGKYYGPRRAILFAKEFGRNIELSIRYGDTSLLREYMENDGNGDLICYINYFDSKPVVAISVLEALDSLNLVDYDGKEKKKVLNNIVG